MQDGKLKYQFCYFNNIGINEANLGVKVNFLLCEQTDANEKKIIFSWITSLPVSTQNVVGLMKAGRARWKIENETFKYPKKPRVSF
ncbi:MAG: putative oxidoreductase [Spirosomataceae bacterium]|jgi:predicted oxidoreductase